MMKLDFNALAFIEGLEELQEVLKSANSVFPPWILYTLLFLTVGTITLLVSLKLYRDNKAQIHAEFAFLRVAKQLGVSRRQRKWLRLVARKTDLCSPLVLMMSRETLMFHLKIYLKSLSKQRQVSEIDRANTIIAKIYGG